MPEGGGMPANHQAKARFSQVAGLFLEWRIVMANSPGRLPYVGILLRGTTRAACLIEFLSLRNSRGCSSDERVSARAWLTASSTSPCCGDLSHTGSALAASPVRA